MKCVVQNYVFETNYIIYMRKELDARYPYICICSINGQEKKFYFNSKAECATEWLRIMKCWRSNEEPTEGHLNG